MRTTFLLETLFIFITISKPSDGFISSSTTKNNQLHFINSQNEHVLQFGSYRSISRNGNGNDENANGRILLLANKNIVVAKEANRKPTSAFSNTTTRRELFHRIAAAAAAAAATLTASSTTTSQRVNAFATTTTNLSSSAKAGMTIMPGSALSSSSSINDPTVLSLKKGSRVVHIVGTAHISSASADLAGRVVDETNPDAVFVELDPMRISSAFKGGIPPPGIKIAVQDDKGKLRYGVTRKTGFAEKLLMKFIHSISKPNMYRQLEMAGFPVGEEFVNSVKAGLDNNSLIILGDRRMDVTLQRISKALKKIDDKKLKILDAKLTNTIKSQVPLVEEWEEKYNRSSSSTKRIRSSDFSEFVETMKTKETTKQLMDVFKREVPDLWKAVVGERDMYMAHGINALDSTQFQTIVAVMGLGHLDGVTKTLKKHRWSVISQS